ncbi:MULTISPECIES: DUF1573 domain-containing protein [Nonlabens]|uniref:Uncharacterized protein DUF1573 n=1 Tax=Nonlabens xylanidelens TaxID=191564 RepID=A0A2S6IJI1_9FLAO|nr:DUF1573 domain-containing protein [Nonlabens xylanidelens]PPK94369.1 uncharacterized protein DUF1573 [Nonlabens xylanidelens]PQJ18712.1 hypothetical protein BST94_07815 [Nonlabens xylanidelens]PQJ18715.1 hypothetical protein BST94_07830 [Nonlabens xylanidelens]PQJ21468.1 hypothetical protein BST94_04555 [Nonlabens xylanidelens]
MKNLLLIFLFTGLVSTSMQAQDSTTLDPMTTVEFETSTIDYGKVEKGSDGVRTFTFKNTGENPLKIYKIYSSCSCDILSKPEEPIAQGMTGEIVVKYDTKKVGPIVKTITAYANIEKKLIPLRLKGEVLPAKEEE